MGTVQVFGKCLYVYSGMKRDICKAMFCRVCAFRVRVWESYRTSRSFGYGYGSVTELTQVPGIVARSCSTHRIFGRVQNAVPVPRLLWHGRTEVSGTGMNVARNSQKVFCTGMDVVQNSQKFWVRLIRKYTPSGEELDLKWRICLLYTSPSPRD